ncbi:MAG: M48 family metalloprotease [Leptolyngbyaceae cyanobacterium MAG.088]|nr:M48 family metalloprotease [Leptolyngbyaceae cyanobacterium MAG.088]
MQKSIDSRPRSNVQPQKYSRSKKCLIATIAAVTVTLPTLPAQAFPWGNLIRQGIQVIQLSNLSPRNEVALGNQIHSNLLRQGMKLYPNRTINAYVNRVGQRLVSRDRGRRRYSYVFQVVSNPQVNAFATMGGRVYVTTGLLKTADSEAELASVLGHEIAHIQERHLVKQIRQRALTTGLIGTATGLNRSQAANIGIELLVNRPRGRDDEYEADEVGLNILRQAGYASSAAPSFMRKLLRSGRRTPTFLSTHPAVPDRVRALERSIQSGRKNECDRNPRIQSCGLDTRAYQQAVHSRL